ncbi:hypothetical protein DIPPA_18721 [Diplonema papillatum]|nr:hypothetical protein DIPPA_18721 [Diplonema papillatum]
MADLARHWRREVEHAVKKAAEHEAAQKGLRWTCWMPTSGDAGLPYTPEETSAAGCLRLARELAARRLSRKQGNPALHCATDIVLSHPTGAVTNAVVVVRRAASGKGQDEWVVRMSRSTLPPALREELTGETPFAEKKMRKGSLPVPKDALMVLLEAAYTSWIASDELGALGLRFGGVELAVPGPGSELEIFPVQELVDRYRLQAHVAHFVARHQSAAAADAAAPDAAAPSPWRLPLRTGTAPFALQAPQPPMTLSTFRALVNPTAAAGGGCSGFEAAGIYLDAKPEDGEGGRKKSGSPERPSELGALRAWLAECYAGGAPVAYLDFETTSFALPAYALKGVCTPFEAVPVQYSLHVDARGFEALAEDIEQPLQMHCDGAVSLEAGPSPTSAPLVTHSEWLHLEPERHNGLPELAALLAAQLSPAVCGRIVVWNASFERGVLLRLAASVPEQAEALRGIVDRLVDLRDVFTQKLYADPALEGSTSLKAVLPVMCSRLSYAGLGTPGGIQHGASAAGFVYETSRSLVPHHRVAELRPSLLRYCRIDTAAMLAIASALARKVR